MYYELTDRFHVAADIDRTWDFFSQADNLPLITPPWLKFTIVSTGALPPIQQDSILDYTIRWLGVPVRWRTKIIDFTPPRQFIDLQVRGPYALWHHQHTFKPADEGGVICADRVIYQLPIPIIRPLVHATIIRRQLLEIFRYRRQVIAQKLGPLRALQADVQISPLR